MGIQINGSTDRITAIDGTIDFVSNIGNIGLITASRYELLDSITIGAGSTIIKTVNGQLGIGTDNPESNKNLHILDQTDRCQVLFESGGNESTQLWLKNPARTWKISNYYDQNALTFTDDSDERLRIDSSGRLLIGDQRTYSDLTYYDDLTINNSNTGSGADGSAGITLVAGDSAWCGLNFGRSGDMDEGHIRYDNTNNAMIFGTGNGGEKLRITSSGQLAIRNSGTTSQSANLIVYGDADNSDVAIFSGGDWSRGLKISTAASVNNDALVILDAQNADNGCFAFKTHGDERLRITSDGRIGMHDSTPNDYELDIMKRSTATDANLRLYNNETGSSNDTILRLHIAGTSASNYIYFGDGDDSNVGQVRYQHSNDSMQFFAGASERFRIDSSGDLSITDGNLVVADGHGISFSATSNHGTATPDELLDDYEEGSWTPVLESTSTNPTISSYSKQQGLYTKIGNVVYLFCFIDIAAGNIGGTLTGDGKITGLPFVISNNPSSTDMHGSACDNLKSIPNTFSSQRNNAMLYFPPGQDYLAIHQYSTTNPIYQTGWGMSQIGNGNRFKWAWTGQYRTDQS